MNKKVLLITEDLTRPFDEGIKKTALNLLQILMKYGDTTCLARKADGETDCRDDVIGARTSRLFLDSKLKKYIINKAPDLIIYLPSASATFASFIRAAVLKSFRKDSRVILFLLQPKNLSLLQKFLLRCFLPDLVLTCSQKLQSMKELGKTETRLIPLPTDLNRFRQVESLKRKRELRKKYGLPENKYIILHVGHLNWGRNLEALLSLQSEEHQVVLAGSTSTPSDAPPENNLRRRLSDHGIMIIERFLTSIEELYQAADLYVFPVTYAAGSISLPLSILEARACGLPVLTTDFGSVSIFLAERDEQIFVSDTSEFTSNLELIKAGSLNSGGRNNVIEFLNSEFESAIKELLR